MFPYFLVLFLLFLLQFVYFPVGISFFEIPKVYGAEIGIFLLLLLSIFFNGFWLWKKKKFLFVTCCMFFLLSFYHLFTHWQMNTFWGNPFRMQGTVLLWFLLIFAWVSSSVRFKRIHFFFFFGVLFLQVILSFWINSGSLGRAIGSMGESNSLAGEMVFLWPFLFVITGDLLKKKFVRGIFYLLTGSMVGLVIFISGSRSGLLAFFLQLLFWVLVRIFHLSFKMGGVICLISLFLLYCLPFLEQNGLYENRGEIWRSAMTAGLQHPFAGVGFGNIEYALHDSNVRLGNHLQGYYVDSSHNIFLDWFVAGGTIGLALLCGLISTAFLRFVQRKEFVYLLLLFGLLGVLSFNPVSVVLLVAFWWVIGQGWNEVISN